MAPQKSSKSKSKKASGSSKKPSTKSSSPPAPDPVPDPPAPAPAPAPAPESELTSDVSVSEEHGFMEYQQLDMLKQMLKTTLASVREMSTMINTLEKQINKDRKVANKKMKRTVATNPDGTKPMNGFSKPGQISDELRSFMGLSDEELVARVDVTKFITKYCQDNGLQNENDKRILIPDEKLQSLLNVDDEVELTYFNLQKYLKFHFPNKDGVFPPRD